MSLDRKKFFDGVRHGPFPGKMTQKQVEGMDILFDAMENAGFFAVGHGNVWRARAAYVLATVFWETGQKMQPVPEGGSQKYLRSKKYYPYYGRGLVQLTWKKNYEKYNSVAIREYDIDIVKDPDALLHNAGLNCHILLDGMRTGSFTGKCLSDYFNINSLDWIGARRIINGTDKAKEIAAIAKQFYADILVATA